MRLLKKIHFTLAIVMTACAVHAQDMALFQVTPGTKVCLGQAFQITDFSTGGNGDVTYFFGDGNSTTPPDPNPSYTYSSANNFTIKQILPISGTVIDPVTGNPTGVLTYSVPVKVVPTTTLSATYTVCGSGRVNLIITDNRFDSYDVDFKDGTGITNVAADPSGTTTSVHIYSTITTYNNVSIKGKFAAGNDCPAADFTLSITPIATVPKPDVVYMETTTENPTSGELTVKVNKNASFDYAWDFKRNGFSYTSNLGTISSGPGSTNLILDKTNTNPYDPATQAALHASYTLNTTNNSYCIRLATKTACGREALSDEICSITKFTGTAGDLQNNLTWEAYSGPNSNTLDVLELSPVNTTLASGLAGSTAAYTHTPVTCAIQYEYQIKEYLTTTSSSGPQYSLSAKKKVTATSLTPRPPLTNLFSTINGSDVTVSFDPPAGFTAKSYTLQESVNGGGYNPVASNNGSPTSFTLNNKNTSGDRYCYKVNYTDICNLSPNASLAQETCPVKLNVGLAEDGSVAVNWTAYSGSTAVTNYTVEVRDENGTLLHSIPAGLSTSTTDILASTAGQLYYIVIGDNTTTSALVELQLSPAVYVPDAFSPNGDSHNDYFELKGRFIKSINLSIFNRWGEPVFHSTDMKDQWDGKVNGGDAAVGTYAYTLEVTGQKGEVIKHKGTITLVR